MNFPLDFYLKDEPNHQGRTFNWILEQSNEWLEENHDWVQWIFPTDEPSKFNKDAPILTIEIIEQLNVPEFHKKIEKAMNRIINDFYFVWKDENTMNGWWINPNDHNYMRISRILKHLYLFKQYSMSLCFMDMLNNLFFKCPEHIGLETFKFWHQNANIGAIGEELKDKFNY